MENFYTSRVLSNRPRVEIIENFLTVELCAHFIEAAAGHLKRAEVVGGDGSVKSDIRTGMNYFLKHDYSEKTKKFGEQIADMVRIPLKNAEEYQIIYYGETQEYKPHFDAFDIKEDIGWNNIKPTSGGQRILTVLMYLNTVEEGGGTVFPKLDLTVEAKQGRAVIFENTLPGTQTPHPLSLHGGAPVLKGEKWAINLWFREQARR